MTSKAPNFGNLIGDIRTGEVVQIGCVYCLGEGVSAPAEQHVAYLWQGTSMCGKHFKSLVVATQNA